MRGESLPRCDPLEVSPGDGDGRDKLRNISPRGICSVGLLFSLPLSPNGDIGLNMAGDRGEEVIDLSVGDEGPDWLVGDGAKGREFNVDERDCGVRPIRRSMGEGRLDGLLTGDEGPDRTFGDCRADWNEAADLCDREPGTDARSSWGISAGSSTGATEESYISCTWRFRSANSAMATSSAVSSCVPVYSAKSAFSLTHVGTGPDPAIS